MKKKKSQETVVLNYLRKAKVKGLTHREADTKFQITRLSRIINRLRKRGYVIDTEMVYKENQYGTISYGVYRLISEPKEA